MMESLLRDRLSLAAVLGAGVVIGVSGLYVYFKVNRGMTRELSHLTRTIESLRKDIHELKAAAPPPTSSKSFFKKCCTAPVLTSTSPAANGGRRPSNGLTDSTGSQLLSGDENEEYFDVSEEGGGELSLDWAALDANVTPPSVQLSTESDLAQFFEEVDRLMAGDDAEQQMAYDKLIGRKADNVGDPEFVWRLVRACYLCCLMAGRAGDGERQKSFIFEGIKYSNIGLAVDDNHAELHKWYAVMLGRSTDFLGIQDKIKNGYLFKEHLDVAIKLRPNDSMLYFMKGRWCYEVSMLSWVERKVASTLFASPPSSTLEEARRQFLEAERFKPGEWKENMLYIAKCLIGEKNYAGAINWLDKSAAIESTSDEEEVVHGEVLQLIAKYKGYRS